MTNEEKLDVVRKGFEAFARLDWVGVADAFSANIVWHNHGSHRFSGEFRGRDATLKMLGEMNALVDNTRGGFEVHDIIAGPDHVVSLVRAKGMQPSTGRVLDVREIHVMHVEDAKITEFWAYSEDQQENDEYWRPGVA